MVAGKHGRNRRPDRSQTTKKEGTEMDLMKTRHGDVLVIPNRCGDCEGYTTNDVTCDKCLAIWDSRTVRLRGIRGSKAYNKLVGWIVEWLDWFSDDSCPLDYLQYYAWRLLAPAIRELRRVENSELASLSCSSSEALKA